MFKYKIDTNNFLTEKLDDDAMGSDVVSANYDLSDLSLTWIANDYQHYKYQYVDADNYNTNVIKYFAIEDSNNNVIDVLTGNSILDTGAEVTQAQLNNLRDSVSEYNYKVVTGTVTLKTDAEKLSSQKKAKKDLLKTEYINDILWTDSARIFYKKWTERNPSDTSYDTWYEDVMTYWDEARAERNINKTSIDNATDLDGIDAIIYSPTHVKTRTELEN